MIADRNQLPASFDARQRAMMGDVAVAVNDGEVDMFKQAGIAAE